MHLELAVARVEAWMKRVLPEGKLVLIPATDPLFSGFFQINPEDVPGYGASDGVPSWVRVLREKSAGFKLTLKEQQLSVSAASAPDEKDKQRFIKRGDIPTSKPYVTTQ
jgi:hypothetical protein